jgi:cell division protein FtsZ
MLLGEYFGELQLTRFPENGRQAGPVNSESGNGNPHRRRRAERSHLVAAPQNYLAVIKVVGIGGGGVNAVNRMIDEGLKGVEFIAINTDAQALLMSDADVKLDVGRELTRGLGAGADPDIGSKAAEDHREEIEEVLKGADMVFVTAGEGGGTGTGGPRWWPAWALARRADDRGHPAVRVRASAGPPRPGLGIERLREEVDTLIVIPNDGCCPSPTGTSACWTRSRPPTRFPLRVRALPT